LSVSVPDLPLEVGKGPTKTLVEIDGRLPTEELASPPDVGPAHLGVIGRKLPVDNLALGSHQSQNAMRYIDQRYFMGIAEVHRVGRVDSE
jgi:hypothetical protein